MAFDIYDVSTGGVPLWSESQTVMVKDGVYNVILGQPGNPINPDIFDGDRYLGVTIGTDAEMTPRQKLTATTYAMKAAKADEADTLDGIDSTALDQSAHVARTDNPHSVTAAQIGAATLSDITWSKLANIPAGFADGVDDTGGITTEVDPTVLPSVKDGVSWGELSDIPAGFADGIDNNSGGTITGITTINPLVGGGTSGTVTLEVDIPFELTGSEDPAIISASNSYATGSGVYGEATNNGSYGNYGGYFVANGYFGRGVAGFATDLDHTNHGGWFEAAGITGRGVYGGASGASGRGVYGQATNTGNVENYGGYFVAKGSNGKGMYAEAPATGYAGYFKGKVYVDSGIEFPDGTVQTTAADAPTWHQKLPAAERFELVMDGEAVLDKETGLVWARNANIDGLKNWQQAISYCANLSISDRKGWRLPEREELASLLDMSVSGSPKLPDGYDSFFTNVVSQIDYVTIKLAAYYWSSTTNEVDSSEAWAVSMYHGDVGTYSKDVETVTYVWPVRSGN